MESSDNPSCFSAKQNAGKRHRNIAALRRMCGGEEGVELALETESKQAPTIQNSIMDASGESKLGSVPEDGGDDYLDNVELGDSDEDDFFDDELDDDDEYQKAMESSINGR